MRGFRYNSLHCRQSKTGCKAANAKVFLPTGRLPPPTFPPEDIERAMIASMTGFAAATREVAENIASVKQASEETGASAESLLNVSGELSRRAGDLQKVMSGFLANL